MKGSDIEFLERLEHFNKPVQIVFSKVDKIKGGRGELAKNLEKTGMEIQRFKNVKPEIYLVSAKHMFGIQELRARILMHF